MLSFFYKLFKDNFSLNAINPAKGAITSFVTIAVDYDINDGLHIKLFITGIFNFQPLAQGTSLVGMVMWYLLSLKQ